jgi:AP-1 complex subunit beta-1
VECLDTDLYTVTLVASAPEVQYVALRNIDLLLQAKPDILSKELRVFFCKYNDPPYVKMQKLEIMVRIANDKNFDQLLAELKEYALEVDMDFVRRAVKAIGQVAIKIESASEKCVNALLDLISTKVNYVVQEATVVVKDILRKYPGYEGVIPTLCEHIDELDEPEARGSLIWIVGEYAEKINNADEILSTFVEGFNEEFTQVSACLFRCAAPSFLVGDPDTNYRQTQLQILTAVVKLFLKKPSTNQGIVQKILQQATADSDNPDIRDRAYVYWRLLSGDLEIAKVSSAQPLDACRISNFQSDPLTSGIENHPFPEACHQHYNDKPPGSPARAAPHRALNPSVGLPQATRGIRRQGPLRRRRDTESCAGRAARERGREPDRRFGRGGCRRRRQQRSRSSRRQH